MRKLTMTSDGCGACAWYNGHPGRRTDPIAGREPPQADTEFYADHKSGLQRNMGPLWLWPGNCEVLPRRSLLVRPVLTSWAIA